MFKFNFKVDEENEDDSLFTSNSTLRETAINDENDSTVWYDFEEVTVPRNILENIDVCRLNSVQKKVGSITIQHMMSGFLLEDIKMNGDQVLAIRKAEEMHSDLIPAIYEGGAKIWECTDDLLTYLGENRTPAEWKGKSVVDLGCGSGLLGIYALINGANVTFQDYNKDVLENITIPNVLLNMPEETDIEAETSKLSIIPDNVRFHAGDWEKWAESLHSDQLYDIILTSETIYNPQNQQKLLNCLCDTIKANGRVYVAAKTYYFGVGGGLRQFESLIHKHGQFQSKIVWISTTGVNREIIELTKIKS